MGSVGTFIRGSGIKRTETISEGIQCVRYGELYTTYTTSFEKTVSFVNEDLANKSKPIQYGDALLTLTGENKQDIGKAVVFLGKERTVIGGDLIQYTNHCFEPLFLSYLLNSPYVVYQKSIASTGDIIVHLSGVKLSNILVAFPPIKEQARIVEAIDNYLPLLSKYDMYNISKSKMDSEIYPLLKKSLLQYAIQGKLVPQDPNDEPVSVLLEHIRTEKEQLIKEGKIKRDKNDSYIYRGSDNSYYEKTNGHIIKIDKELPFKIPATWTWARLKHIFNMQAGNNISSYEISETKDNRNIYKCYGGNGIRGYVDKYNNTGNHPIIGRQGALCGNIKLAQGNFYATEHAVVVTVFSNTDFNWAAIFLEALNLNQYATATAQPGLAVSKISNVLIPVPPAGEQQQIYRKITELYNMLV